MIIKLVIAVGIALGVCFIGGVIFLVVAYLAAFGDR